MNGSINSVLVGAVSMACCAVSLFFLRFWRRTNDRFFLLFALSFAIDGLSRFILGIAQVTNESEWLYFVPRLVSFGLIIVAIALKNRPGNTA